MSDARQRPSSQETAGDSLPTGQRTDLADQQQSVARVIHSWHMPSDKPNILKALLSLQEQVGYVPLESIPHIAEALGVTESDIAGVLTYYPDLHTHQRGRHLIRVCLGEACVANRGIRLLAELTDELRIGLGGTTIDGQFTLERVYCLGNCGVGPTVMVDDMIYGRMTGATLRSLLKRCQGCSQEPAN
jgi:NADH:ubiquinone oxidoreductase subunit E